MLNINRLCPGCMKDNSGESVCSICGYNASSNNPPDKLPVRFIIRDRYYVGKVLFANSESTVYLGYDTVENKPVSIKEFFPFGLCERNPDKTVFASKAAQYAFNEGLMDFVETNRKFIGYPLASLPSVYSVFEENSTAYAICETQSGITLSSFLARNGGTLRWEQARSLFLPLIDTVKALNDMGIVHGSISPDTVIVCRDGKLRLLCLPIDGVKQVRQSPDSLSLKPILCDGYSAAEQYSAAMPIGGYTDVYGICATLFTVLIGNIPPNADERMKNDRLSIPAHFADELPRQVLVALANGMQVKASDRTADIDTLKNELIYGETKENIRKAQRASESDSDKNVKIAAVTPEPKKEKKKGSGVKYAAIAAGITVLCFLIIGAVLALTVFKDKFFGSGSGDTSSSSSTSDSSDQSSEEETASKIEVNKFAVPSLLGKTFEEAKSAYGFENIKPVIKGKLYSNQYKRGQICEMSIQPGEMVEYGTKVELYISLGALEFRMPDLVGAGNVTEDKAVIALMKLGIIYENIEIDKKSSYEPSKLPGTVTRQSPAAGTLIDSETVVEVRS